MTEPRVSANPFGERRLAWLGGLGGFSLLLGGVLFIFGSDLFDPPSSGSDVFSTSAFGHRGFFEVLEALGVSVEVSRAGSGQRAADVGVLVVAEPTIGEPTSPRARRMRGMLSRSRCSLVVLPKWGGIADGSGRVRGASLIPQSEVENILEVLELKDATDVIRFPSLTSSPGWIGAPGFDMVPSLVEPQLLNSFGLDPGFKRAADQLPRISPKALRAASRIS